MSKTTPRARSLRRDTTDAERLLWRHLRDRQLANQKFRRQQPLGPFVVDFVCQEQRLVIEIDGGQHAAEGVDAERTRWLNFEGYCVLRFWNHEVLDDIDGVLSSIADAVGET